MARNHRRRAGAKPHYQWFGGAQLLAVKTTVSTTLAEVILLRPAHTSLDADRSVIIKRVILSAQIHRVTSTLVEAFDMAVAIQQVDSASNITDVLDIQSGDAFVAANKAIVHWGCLPVPGTIFDTNTPFTRQPARDLLCVNFDFKVNRRVDLAREALTLTTAADVSGVLKMHYSWRILVQTS